MKKMTYPSLANVCLLFLVCFLTACSQGQSPETQLIPKDSLRADLRILKTTLEEAHPALYLYSAKHQIDSVFRTTAQHLPDSLTSLEFFKRLLPLIAEIRCSHTRLSPSPRSSDRPKFVQVLPFNILLQDGKCIFVPATADSSFAGVEVVSIDGHSAREVTDFLLTTLPSDGYNLTSKYRALAKGAFREGYGLFYGQREQYSVIFKKSDGTPDTVLMKAVTFNTEMPLQQAVANELHFAGDTAFLTIRTFVQPTHRFSDTMNLLFSRIRAQQSKVLLLDISDNPGGNNGNVPALYSFFTAEPFLHLRSAEAMGVKLTYQRYVLGRPIEHDMRKRLTNGNYDVADGYPGARLKRQSDLAFTGKVILKISGNTHSAASEFAALMKYHNRADIIGEETGGCYYGGTGGIYYRLRLPHSGVEITIPTVMIKTAVDENYNLQPKGRGTLPD